MKPQPSYSRLLIAFCLLTLAACSQTPQLDQDILGQAQVLNLRETQENVVAGGQPSEEQFQIIAQSGVRHVINLRPHEEQDFDEAEVVRSLNMEYHSIPVAGGAGVTRENAQALYDLLEELNGEPVIIHCASGNRVGALIALSSQQNQGMDAASALAEGQRWGLSSPRLIPVVEARLAEN